MFRCLLSIACFFSLPAIPASAADGSDTADGFEITVTLKPFKNEYVYLGYYYGKIRALADSVKVNENSQAVFRSTEPLKGGIYFIVSPAKQILFELLIDEDQQFSITADTANLPGSVHFEGSAENERFQHYSVFAAVTGKQVSDLNRQYASARTGSDSSALAVRIRALTGSVQRYRDSIEQKYPGSLLAALFLAMEEPKIPPASEHPGGRYDSNFVYEFFKGHYWDHLSFSDDRLVRTPFFEPKLEKYFNDLVSPHPDSLAREIDRMLLYSRTAKEMYRYLMIHFVQKYVNPTYMGQDAVFVHLFEKYINTGNAEFFSPQYREFTEKRAYSLMANLIGKQAPQLNMLDTLNRPLPLYNQKAEFIVICFWDPTCSHCKEVVPRVDSMYRAKWKAQDVKIYGVKVDGTPDQWKDFIAAHGLEGWSHVYQPDTEQQKEVKEGRAGYKQLYDVYQTPMLYLLDREKRIIAKKLTYLQIDEVIDAKILSQKRP